MSKFEVTTQFLVHTTVKVVVEAESKEAAVDAIAAMAPNMHDRAGWSATVYIKAPPGVSAAAGRVSAIEQTSGSDRARKIA